MAEKKIIVNKPKVGDISQYNFSDNETDFSYNNSTGLPKNNDKFQNKDLFTNCVGDEVNEAIVEKNLKFEGKSEIKIENLYISNTGVDGTVKSNHVAGWIFSQEAYGGDPTKDGYSTVRDKMKDEWKFYSQGFGNKSEGTDIGNITAVEGIPILSNFSVDSPQIILGDIEGRTLNFDTSLGVDTPSDLEPFKLNTSEMEPSQTSIFNEDQYNPIYIVIYTRGDKKVAWPVNTDRRKKKYSIFKINSDDLFERSGNNYIGKVYQNNFTSPTRTRTGEGGGGATQSAWRVTSLQISINTSAGVKNAFSGVSNYQQFITQVLPKSKINENAFNSVEWLAVTNPAVQLDNTLNAGSDSPLQRHPDFIPFTSFGFSQNGELATSFVDLQSYNYDLDLVMKSSSPLNVTFNINIKGIDGNDLQDEASDTFYYYFVIDWNDTEEKFKTIGDWLDSKPENTFDYLEKINQNLYKVRKVPSITFNTDPNYLATLPFPQYREEFDISSFLDNAFINLGLFRTEYGQLHQHDISRWRDVGRPDIAEYLQELNIQDVFYNNSFPPFYDYEPDTELQIPSAQDAGVTPQSPTDFLNPSSVFAPSPFNRKLNNVYTTPGTKNLKYIMFSVFTGGGEFEVGRWKLCTSRFYIDIPPNQYPDFGDVGGSDYVTIPWPYTTPIIGGVSEDSKYKTSIQNTLGGGKIGELDILDERFLVDDLENDEMGKNIETMDLEQCRYFDEPYSIYNLLNIDAAQESNTTPEYLSTLPFPQYFEEFDITGNGNVDALDSIQWVNVGRPDIAEWIVINSTGPTEEYLNLTNGNGLEQLITNFFNNNIKKYDNQNYYDGETNKFPMESSVGQIFISDNLDLNLKQSCRLELNTGETLDKSIIDSSGNSNKGLLIGDYKVKKVKKGQSMRRDSFIKVPKKTGNTEGAL